MARVWTDGFELGSLAGYLTSGASFNSTHFYGGARSVYMSSGYVDRSLSTALSELYVRAAHRASSAGATGGPRLLAGGDLVCRAYRDNATGLWSLRDNANNVLDTGSQATNADTWYVIELHVLIAEAGRIELRIDGETEAEYDGDTRFGAATNIGSVRLYSVGYWDDLAINDTTGAADNSWCGPGKVYYMPAASDTSTQWTSSAEGANYLMVDEVPHDSDTTYVQTATNGHTDVYGLGTPPAAMEGKIIKRAWPEAVCRKTEAEEGLGISLGITIGTTTDDGDEIAPGVAYSSARIIGDEHLTNPDTTEAWNFSELDDIKVRLNAHVAAE